MRTASPTAESSGESVSNRRRAGEPHQLLQGGADALHLRERLALSVDEEPERALALLETLQPGFEVGLATMASLDVLDILQNEEGYEVKFEFYDGTAATLSDAAEVSDGEWNTDGGVLDLEFSGNIDFI